MRVALLHNPDAGGRADSRSLRREIESAGHEVVLDIADRAHFDDAIAKSVDLVAIAGGDGTVRTAVHALHGKGVPLAILPVGTANNIAQSLGLSGPPGDLAKRWGEARRVPFDLGRARTRKEEHLFVEGIGAGLVPEAIASAKAHGKETLARADGGPIASSRRIHRETLESLSPRRLSLAADGERLDDEYLLVEVLNIPSVGPNLRLSGDASPSDGAFDLVTAGEAERGELLAVVEDETGKRRPNLPSRRVRSVEIGGWRVQHVDDELRSGVGPGRAAIEILPGAVEFLA